MHLWSDAITCYNATDADQYGAFRVGPSYPLNVNPIIKIPQFEYAMFKGICFPHYFELSKGRETYVSIRVPAEIEALNKMQALMDEGIEIMESIEDKNEKLERLINMGKFMTHSITTGINAKKMFQLRNKMRVAENNDELNKVLDDMEAVVKAEIKNAEETIPLVEVDSRLGWEPTMEYMTDKERIEWKIRACEYTLNSEIQTLRNVTKL